MRSHYKKRRSYHAPKIHKLEQKPIEFTFEIKVTRDSIQHDIAAQTAQYLYADRDTLYYRATLAQKNDYDELLRQALIPTRNRKGRIR